MDKELTVSGLHPSGEGSRALSASVDEPLSVDSFAGRIEVRWAPDEAVTALGQLSFFCAALIQRLIRHPKGQSDNFGQGAPSLLLARMPPPCRNRSKRSSPPHLPREFLYILSINYTRFLRRRRDTARTACHGVQNRAWNSFPVRATTILRRRVDEDFRTRRDRSNSPYQPHRAPPCTNLRTNRSGRNSTLLSCPYTKSLPLCGINPNFSSFSCLEVFSGLCCSV